MRTRDFLVGVTFFGLLTLLGVFTIFLADFRLGAGHEMVVPFTDVGGLAEGAEVRIDGLTSGRVRGMERGPKGDRVLVALSFDREPVLAADATFEISSASPLGGRVVEIWSNPSTRKKTPPAAGEPWPGPGPNALDALSGLVQGNEERVNRILANLEELTAELNRPDEKEKLTLAQALRRTVLNLKDATRKLSGTEGTLGMLLNDPKVREDIASAAASVREVADELADEKSGAVLARLLRDEELGQDVKDMVANLEEATAKLKGTEGTLGMLLNDEDVRKDLEDTFESIRKVADELADKENQALIARLLRDKELADRVASAVAKLDSAAGDISQATAGLEAKEGILGMLLYDQEARKQVQNSIKALSDFIETTRENAPITTFAGILLSPF